VSDPLVLVHGGAGAWALGSRRLDNAVAACRDAAIAGQDALMSGGSALDAVEAAVRVLEDFPVLNAGRGSYPTTDGTVELDAMVMDGATLDLGAVAAVRGIANPVSLARLVMTRTPHTLLVAHGAEQFADSVAFPRCENEDLIVARTEAETRDTVGAVAIDARGNLAAATSTGGIPRKLPGRVGDSPLVGAGTYADNASAAVCATGDGEALMKVLISKTVCDLIASGLRPQAACQRALADVATRFGAHGGLIALNPHGEIGVTCNSAAMPYAYVRPGRGPVAGHQPARV
jgi:beta-aspartyl-peptidase (threonine type)